MLEKLINDLLNTGFSQMLLAEEIGVSQSTVSRMKDGLVQDCPKSTYDRIEGLHKKRCKKSAAVVS